MTALAYVGTPIRVIVADVYPVMRTGLITTIESDPEMQVVGIATHRHDLMPQLRAAGGDVLVINSTVVFW